MFELHQKILHNIYIADGYAEVAGDCVIYVVIVDSCVI